MTRGGCSHATTTTTTDTEPTRSHYYDETGQTAPQRDQTILAMRRRGYSYRAIGKAVGMTANGVMTSLRRIQDGRPGRDPRARRSTHNGGCYGPPDAG